MDIQCKQVNISAQELQFSYALSSGPGGQNVNKTSTKVILKWDLVQSTSLNEKQKERLLRLLKNKITQQGFLTITSQKTRSQDLNKLDCIEKLRTLVDKNLTVKKRRVPTKPKKSAVEERIKEKKKKGEHKQNRKKIKF
jgi:ribosome-associated protein